MATLITGCVAATSAPLSRSRSNMVVSAGEAFGDTRSPVRPPRQTVCCQPMDWPAESSTATAHRRHLTEYSSSPRRTSSRRADLRSDQREPGRRTHSRESPTFPVTLSESSRWNRLDSRRSSSSPGGSSVDETVVVVSLLSTVACWPPKSNRRTPVGCTSAHARTPDGANTAPSFHP